MTQVAVKPWVVDDVATILRSHNPLFRPLLGRVLFELHNDLPRTLHLHRHKRIAGSPACFLYERIYVSDQKLLLLSFVVRDADTGNLEVLWVLATE